MLIISGSRGLKPLRRGFGHLFDVCDVDTAEVYAGEMEGCDTHDEEGLDPGQAGSCCVARFLGLAFFDLAWRASVACFDLVCRASVALLLVVALGSFLDFRKRVYRLDDVF